MPISKRVFLHVVEGWSTCHRFCVRHLLRIRIEVEGVVPARGVLVAFKHESFFEAIDLPLGAASEVPFESLVGIETENPLRARRAGSGVEPPPVRAAVPLLDWSSGLAQKRQNARLARHELGRAVERAVVECHHAVDVWRHVGEPVREETHLVAKGERGEQAVPPRRTLERAKETAQGERL